MKLDTLKKTDKKSKGNFKFMKTTLSEAVAIKMPQEEKPGKNKSEDF